MANSSKDRSSAPVFLAYLLLVLAVGFLVWRLWPGSDEGGPPLGKQPRETGGDKTAGPRVIVPRGSLADDEKSTIELFKAASPSVVNVTSLALRRDRFNLNVQEIPRGTGSGFVWDEKGRIVTNYHVIKGSSAIHVTLADHSTWKVYQAKYDEDKDLAVLWTDAPKERLSPLPVGESSNLLVGQKVFAIGNPFGLDQTLTTGIISALNREIESDSGQVIKGVIQTDAAINPGNSGGPLLDSAGRIIGVNTAIISPSGSSAGIGFAIPVDTVNRVVPRLIRFEKEARPSLGITPAPDQWTRQLGAQGVLILDLVPKGPAEKAGLRSTRRDEFGRIRWGDIITAVDTRPVKSAKELFALLEDNYQVGQEVTVVYERDEEEHKTKMTLTADTR
jgi:S1-C subfamily serine protease